MLRNVLPQWLNPTSKLLALVCWREARGESLDTKKAVCCSIRNRVQRPGWWGHDYVSVILCPWQYSSFNPDDPNAVKYPEPNDKSFAECFEAALYAMNPANEDVSKGADSYFDKSLDKNLPKWATAPTSRPTIVLGRLRFFSTVAQVVVTPGSTSVNVPLPSSANTEEKETKADVASDSKQAGEVQTERENVRASMGSSDNSVRKLS